MLNDIMLGQYFPAFSIWHRMDARVKLFLLLLYIIFIFVCHTGFSYAILTVLVLIAIFTSKIPCSMYFKSLKPMLLIIAFTFIIHVFSGEGTPLFKIGVFTATKDGIEMGIFITLRLVLLMVSASILTFTTSPLVLTDALEAILRPLKRFGVPAHELSMMMTIALRFIPTLIDETDKIIKAQKSRGADFSSGSIVKRVSFVMPILIPLFINAFRRADELAIAMEARCYRGDEGRTHMKQMKLARLDYQTLGIAIFLTIVLVVLAWKGY